VYFVVDAVEQRDGKRPLRELEERSLKPYKRRYNCCSAFCSQISSTVSY